MFNIEKSFAVNTKKNKGPDNMKNNIKRKSDEYLAMMKKIDPDEFEDQLSWAEIDKMTENDLVGLFEKNWQEIKAEPEHNNEIRDDENNIEPNRFAVLSKDDYIDDTRDIDGLMEPESREEVDFYYENNMKILERLSEIGSEKAIDFVINFVLENKEAMHLYSEKLLGIIRKNVIAENSMTKKVISVLAEKQYDEVVFFKLLLLALEKTNVENFRSILNEQMDREKESAVKIKKFNYLNSFITPNSDKIAIRNLQEFYQTKIKFEDYKVNELMNEKEVALLESLIGKDDKTLEMGCGAGRLICELAKSGQDISGYDYTKRHVQITKENLEKNKLSAKVFQGDWHNNALKDESFDVVYSLGRNILHDYSILSQAELFKEAVRILKPGGQFIFDIPNRTKGNYRELVEGYAAEMKKRGIQNFRYGSIYDSPDGKNFATRYAYSPEDIEQLAQLSGFEIAEVKKEKLETGKDDENLYFILKKKK
jgi:SAM-dependent methyltransferase